MSQEFFLDAPLPGTVETLSRVPDRAFADEMLGPGVAIYPEDDQALTVCAPASGLVRTIHPHAFVLQVSPKLAALIHLGVDTYRADASHFRPLVEQGRYVTRLQPIIEWDIAKTVQDGFSPWVVVTILGFKAGEMELEWLAAAETRVSTGQELFKLTTEMLQEP